MNLYISLHPVNDSLRADEINTCLKLNTENSVLKKVFALNEGFVTTMLEHPKVSEISTSCRPNFSHFYDLLDSDSWNIIANNDIYFDETLSYIKMLNLTKGDFLALTRKEVNGELFRSQIGDSQDVWIFFGKPEILKIFNFYMGIPGCDNVMAYKFYESGYRVCNPAKIINCWHIHSASSRGYSEMDRLHGMYLLLKPVGFIGFHYRRFVLWIYNKIKRRMFEIYYS
jgi:hypothetical protein